MNNSKTTILPTTTEIFKGLVVAFCFAFIGIDLFIIFSRLFYPYQLEWMEGAGLVQVNRLLGGQNIICSTFDRFCSAHLSAAILLCFSHYCKDHRSWLWRAATRFILIISIDARQLFFSRSKKRRIANSRHSSAQEFSRQHLCSPVNGSTSPAPTCSPPGFRCLGIYLGTRTKR